MSKTKSAFFCQDCGHESPKWLGKCPGCHSWNTLIEEIKVKKSSSTPFSRKASEANPKQLNEIKQEDNPKFSLNDSELNRVLGGGVVQGSLILIGGDPGIGKSTLMLQLAIKESIKILYVSGEESEQQIKMRAERIGIENQSCFILTETNLDAILNHTSSIEPKLIVIDSIQTLHSNQIESAPGSVSQVRECTSQLLRLAKEKNIAILLIGHITKDGSIAGPKVLEHMVDTVLQFEGDRNHMYRLLRTSKNRFGSTNEIGIYEMQNNGLRIVENPSEILVTNSDSELSGVAISATLEGLRPFLIEIQALVSSAVYGTPQRSSTGYDSKRLNMLLAVLEKRCGFKLGAKDVFLNIAGGIKVDDPGIDLAVSMAVLSSNANLAIPEGIAFSAEVGLSGEIRPVNRIDQRIGEVEKLGFKKIIISNKIKGFDSKKYGIEIVQCSKIDEVVRNVFS
ncbi:DNA repair protein RadA [Crocinitomicaceae bacterium]|jgi:DNA repair protein RadA/Sms|nr:DNA repair protein RadA [Crocinitomicaceae bacterium]MDO7610498.1 DNA repair protein RadA [Crocinitomicaceae bacterium]